MRYYHLKYTINIASTGLIPYHFSAVFDQISANHTESDTLLNAGTPMQIYFFQAKYYHYQQSQNKSLK